MVISLLIYALVLKGYVDQRLHWIWAAVLSAVLPWLILSCILLASQFGNEHAFYDIFSFTSLVTLAVQILVALIIFWQLEIREGSVYNLVLIGSLGAVGVYMMSPYMVSLLLN